MRRLVLAVLTLTLAVPVSACGPLDPPAKQPTGRKKERCATSAQASRPHAVLLCAETSPTNKPITVTLYASLSGGNAAQMKVVDLYGCDGKSLVTPHEFPLTCNVTSPWDYRLHYTPGNNFSVSVSIRVLPRFELHGKFEAVCRIYSYFPGQVGARSQVNISTVHYDDLAKAGAAYCHYVTPTNFPR